MTEKAKEKTIPVLLKRAHWVGEERHEPGEVLEVTLEEALRLIEAGVAGRTDTLKADG